jgi:hypothetical protein
MNEAKARAIVLDYFTKPDFDRVEYLKQQQAESGRPPDIFARYIVEAFEYFLKLLESRVHEARAMGNDITNIGIHFWHLAPDKYPPGRTLFLSDMAGYFKGINQYIESIKTPPNDPPAGKDKKKPKHIPSEKEREGLYQYYMDKVFEKKHRLWRVVNKWSKPDYRTHCNGNAKSYNTKLGHLQAVKTRLLSNKSKAAKKGAERCKRDIQQLKDNWENKVPG